MYLRRVIELLEKLNNADKQAIEFGSPNRYLTLTETEILWLKGLIRSIDVEGYKHER